MAIPQGYDPVTLNHWLWFKYHCHEGSASEFQRLFENILKRSQPQFIQIRPYGNIGDRKADGLLFADGTIFQVYSPDELRQAEVQTKIDEDLAGAVEQWGDVLRRWVFVYNVRRGLAPDIPRTLHAKQQEYPDVKIDHMSSDELWEMARGLSLQQRAEVLGAPAGYEHLFLSAGTTSPELDRKLDSAYLVLVQDVLSPINIREVVTALAPDVPFGAPFFIGPVQGELPWEEVAEYQQQLISEIVAQSRALHHPRFAVFSLAPTPLATQLGFLLSDRVDVRYFQFDRDRRTWCWPDSSTAQAHNGIRTAGVPSDPVDGVTEAIIRVSLSANIGKRNTDEAISGRTVEIDISVDQPDVMSLHSPSQVLQLGQVLRQVLAAIRANVPDCTRIHLFYAGPTGGAIIIGQQINPRMNPPVELYEYSQQTIPRYQRALTLK